MAHAAARKSFASWVDFGRLATVLLIVALCCGWLFWSYRYVEDDGFIHLEFARSLARGEGFSFHGVPTYGDTSPAWVLAQSLLFSLIHDPIIVTKTISALGVLASLSGAFMLSKTMFPTSPAAPWLTTIAVALNPFYIHWSFAGMEAASAAGLVCWTLYLLNKESTLTRDCLAAFLAGMAPLLRPELIIFLAIFGPIIVLRTLKTGLERPSAARMLITAASCLLLCGPTLIWIFYAIDVFGYAIPNTNAAKKVSLDLSVRSLILAFMFGFPIQLISIAYVVIRYFDFDYIRNTWTDKNFDKNLYAIIYLWIAATIAFYIVNKTYVQTRYALVLGCILTVLAVGALLKNRPTRLVYSLIAGIIIYSAAADYFVVFRHVANKMQIIDTTARISSYLREHIDPKIPVAVFNIGQIGFEAPNPIVDIGGILQPEASRLVNDRSAMVAWAAGKGAKYWIEIEPPNTCSLPLIVEQAPFVGWSIDLSRYEERYPYGIWTLSECP